MKIIIIGILLTIISSCQSNAIHFDVNEQAIKSCNQKGIRQIYINCDTSLERYDIFWADTIKNAPTIIKLMNIQSGYKIYFSNNKKNNQLVDNLKLMPSLEYTIERDQGDAGEFLITVWTDTLGIVNKTSHSDCK